MTETPADSASPEASSRVSVSEEKLRRILAEERVYLVEQLQRLATRDAVTQIGARVTRLEMWRAAQDAARETKREISNRQFALATFFAALVGSLATLIWLHHG